MKYPSILRLSNGCIVLAIKDKCGVALSEYTDEYEKTFKHKYYEDFYGFESAKNITAEYLANTYGEVKSKAHAEFIVKLAEVAKGKNITVINLNEAKSFVFDSDGCLKFYKSNVNDIWTGNLKQITIPLPPECEGVGKTPFEVVSNGAIYKLSEGGFYALTGNGKAGVIYESASLDNLMKAKDFKILSFTSDNAEIEDIEWPKVGDEVLFQPNPSQPNKIKAEIKYIGEKFTILKSESGREFSRRNAKILIEKPKTPEQELRDFISLLWDENNHDFDMFLDIVAEHVIKKPQ